MTSGDPDLKKQQGQLVHNLQSIQRSLNTTIDDHIENLTKIFKGLKSRLDEDKQKTSLDTQEEQKEDEQQTVSQKEYHDGDDHGQVPENLYSADVNVVTQVTHGLEVEDDN